MVGRSPVSMVAARWPRVKRARCIRRLSRVAQRLPDYRPPPRPSVRSALLLLAVGGSAGGLTSVDVEAAPSMVVETIRPGLHMGDQRGHMISNELQRQGVCSQHGQD